MHLHLIYHPNMLSMTVPTNNLFCQRVKKILVIQGWKEVNNTPPKCLPNNASLHWVWFKLNNTCQVAQENRFCSSNPYCWCPVVKWASTLQFHLGQLLLMTIPKRQNEMEISQSGWHSTSNGGKIGAEFHPISLSIQWVKSLLLGGIRGTQEEAKKYTQPSGCTENNQ